jgi:hypothetical protein
MFVSKYPANFTDLLTYKTQFIFSVEDSRKALSFWEMGSKYIADAPKKWQWVTHNHLY